MARPVGRPRKTDAPEQAGKSSVAVLEKPQAIPSTQETGSLETPPEANYPSRVAKTDRLNIPLDPTTGVIDWGSMQDGNRVKAADAIKKSMGDKEFLKNCGIAPIELTAKPQVVTPITMGLAFDVIAKIEAGVYAKKTGLPYEDVYKICEWDKDDHRILDTQASGLVNKYIPASWLQYADLGIFASTMYGLMKQKAALVEELAKKRFENIVGSDSPKSPSVIPPSQPSTPSPAASTQPATPPIVPPSISEIPSGEASRSLEEFSGNPAPPAGNNHRSLE